MNKKQTIRDSLRPAFTGDVRVFGEWGERAQERDVRQKKYGVYRLQDWSPHSLKEREGYLTLIST